VLQSQHVGGQLLLHSRIVRTNSTAARASIYIYACTIMQQLIILDTARHCITGCCLTLSGWAGLYRALYIDQLPTYAVCSDAMYRALYSSQPCYCVADCYSVVSTSCLGALILWHFGQCLVECETLVQSSKHTSQCSTANQLFWL
jgi:hypothetical protein